VGVSLLHEMQIMVHIPMKMYCNNQSAVFITNNPMYHKRTKHIEVDCHFIHDLVIKKQIVTPYVRYEDQLGNILTKPLICSLFSILYSKLACLIFMLQLEGTLE